MKSKDNRKSGAGEIQVFELTMDNTEDQDELNRRLRKPGEPPYCPPPKGKSTDDCESSNESPNRGPG